jgi:hypothetical protein
MFGTLRPSLCGLPLDDRQAYRRAYCGTCKALGDDYGQVARPLLSYDMVFLAAIVEGCQREPSQTASCRWPHSHRPWYGPTPRRWFQSAKASSKAAGKAAASKGEWR